MGNGPPSRPPSTQQIRPPAPASQKTHSFREAGRLETSIAAAEKDGLEPVVFLHYPPFGIGYYCEEFMNILKAHRIKRCYYGHLHGRAAFSAIEGEHEGIVFRLISCDHLNFMPIIVQNSASS